MQEFNERSKLPISHPDYLYPSSGNPYWKKILETKSNVYADHKGEQFRGKWKEKFSDSLPSSDFEIHVEIGCNGGHVSLGWAQRNPNHAYIGIDWKHKQVYLAHQKSVKRKVSNIAFIRGHAERIHYVFSPNEISRINVYFPDPWERKTQWKYRYLTHRWFDQAFELLRPGGTLHLKTDHREYFDWILSELSLSKKQWKIREKVTHLHEMHPNPSSLEIPDVTLFEKLFIKDQIPICSLKIEKPTLTGH